MDWIKVKLSELNQVQELNNNVYHLFLSPKVYQPKSEEDYDTEVILVKGKGIPSTYTIKETLLSLINEYDKSNNVNGFIFGNEIAYFDKLTRLGLINSLNIEKELEKETSIIWINNKSYEINIDYMLLFLKELEDYAMQVFQVTQEHIAAISNLNRYELLAYNITENYPSKLSFDITKISK